MKRLSILIFSLFPILGHSERIEVPTSTKTVAELGRGYNKKQESFRGPCIKGTSVFLGRPEANLDFKSTISQEQLAKHLGIGAGGRVRNGAITYSAAANFLKSTKESGYSISAIYMGDYKFKHRYLKNVQLTRIGKKFENNPKRWLKTCGDYVTTQHVIGAKIFFSIRIDFKTRTDKRAFSANFGVSGPLVNISAKVASAKNKFSKNAQVTVQAFQLGGDIQMLSKIFHDQTGAGGPRKFVQCSMGDFKKCETVLTNALSYATNVKTGFPSQIDPDSNVNSSKGPALLKTLVDDYESLGIYVGVSNEMKVQSRLARRRIGETFEKLFHQYNRASALTKNSIVRLAASQREKLLKIEAGLYKSLQKVVKASEGCYNNSTQCPALFGIVDPAVPANGITVYPESTFYIKPVNAAQFCDIGRSYYSTKGQKKTINALVATAKKMNPKAFIPPTAGAKVDECLIMQEVVSASTKLNLANKGLSDLEVLKTFPRLTELDLSHNSITSLQYVAGLTKLTKLNLSRNRISNPALLSKLRNLVYLNLSENDISNARTLRRLHGMVRLDLRNNRPEIKCPYDAANRCLIADYRYNNSFVKLDRDVNIGRWGHSSVLLKNGDVLITGGIQTVGGQREMKRPSQGEIFQKKNSLFKKIAFLKVMRSHHTSTRLDDGNVLVAGGFGAFTSAELFNVKSKTFQKLPAMNYRHTLHQATKLKDGTILITGGFKSNLDFWLPNRSTATAEVYDPKTKKFIKKRSMTLPRGGHTATLLNDGQVLIVGGFTNKKGIASAELYNPNTGAFTRILSRLQGHRGFHSAVKLGDGRVVILGGFGRDNKALNSIEIYDPKTKSFKKVKAPMSAARGNAQASILPGGNVFITGGTSEFVGFSQAPTNALKSAEIFDPISNISTGTMDRMDEARDHFSLTPLKNNRFLIFGGRGIDAGFSAEIFEFGKL